MGRRLRHRRRSRPIYDGNVAFVDVLAVHAATTPHKAAVIEGNSTTDFESLNRRANKAANVLAGLGCDVHDRVASMWFNSTTGFELSHGL
ncbi:MAG: long-chain fatty acid--CoA ligase, partial [Chloroflexi bacterium]